jgi:quinol-cytochrome oxidoreductase complex cytochrome b subunit
MKSKLNKKRLIIWLSGFIVLLLIDLLVEFLLLPLIGLDHTPKNDIYFQCWWIVVGIWFVFGLIFLRYIERKSLK